MDAHYQFIAVDIGPYSSGSDGGVWCSMGVTIENYTKMLTGYSRIPGTAIDIPHVFVGDEAFQLCPNFICYFPVNGQTFSKRIFNYRLSRAR